MADRKAMRWAAVAAVVLAVGAAVGRAGEAGEIEGVWVHAGPHSAVVCWRLKDLADEATGYVEYGPTAALGHKTPATAEPRWAQFHRITGLTPGARVHYRPVVVRGGKTTRAPAGVFTTASADGWTPLPGKLAGSPYAIDRPGKYLLTRDITASATAIRIDAADVVLELDGRTITFGTGKGKQAAGIQITAAGAVAVRNGVVVQGEKSADYSAAIESRWRAYPREIAAMAVTVHRPNGYPIKFLGAGAGAVVHHNLLTSRVTEIESRHYPGNDLLRLDVGKGARPCDVHDNLLTGGCHRGISINGESPGTTVHHNDVRHHAMYVNGYAINLHAPGIDCYGNRVTSTGRGMHLTRPGLHVHDNRLDLRGHATLDDMPAKSRPFKRIMVELHGIKFEGAKVTGAKVHGNFVRIRQPTPAGDVRYVPATPLNIACYNPAAMNEVYDNDIIALTAYRAARMGGYGQSGQWASAIHFVGMTRGPAPAGKYSAYLHDNRFVTNHLFASSSRAVTQTVRVEKNTFTLAKDPPPVPATSRFRRIGPLEAVIRAGGNTFR